MLVIYNRFELNSLLLQECIRTPINLDAVEILLKRGAEPLGKVEYKGEYDNLYTCIIDEQPSSKNVTEQFLSLTELFIKYGMRISEPEISYDEEDIINPMWYFSFKRGEVIPRTLKLLLDNGLSPEDACLSWACAMEDFLVVDGELNCESAYEAYKRCIRNMLLNCILSACTRK